MLKGDKVLLAQRNPKLSFLGGWHAFSGGKLDQGDAEITVKNCQDIELERFIVCAVRELFEEIGVLIVRNGDKLTKGQRASLHDDLISGRSSFKEILDHWGLWIDAEERARSIGAVHIVLRYARRNRNVVACVERIARSRIGRTAISYHRARIAAPGRRSVTGAAGHCLC